MKRVIRGAIAVLLWVQLSIALAQNPISVLVSDSGGRVVEGARVEILLDGRSVASAFSNQAGEASFAALPPAHYQISVSKDGFEALRQSVQRSRSPSD